MNLLSIQNCGKQIADKQLYDSISFGIDDSDKIGLIGANGCGKSTLLKILSGLDEFDSGNFTINNLTKVGYLEQVTNFDPHQTIIDFVFSSNNERILLLRTYFEMYNNADVDPHNDDKLLELEHKFEQLEVKKLESEARELLFQFGIKELNQTMGQLSGGMVKKVALARLLLEDNNLLLIDEPTNHLDIQSIFWLEEHLIKTKKAVMVITHDRYFLENVVNIIVEIDQKKIFKYKGNYDAYLQKKAEVAEVENRAHEKKLKALKRDMEWLNRMPKARGTKQKARIQSVEQTQQQVSNYKKDEKMAGFFSKSSRLGKRILEVKNISKSFDEKIFSNFSYEFMRKEKIAIIGENGAGKTTFLNVLMEKLPSDSGTINFGVNTKIGYLSQVSSKINESLNVLQAVKEVANYIELDNNKKITATQILDQFLFTGGQQNQKVNRLSGGERRRLDIVLLLMTNPNFLILDEPTNDLDIQTLNVLEEYLIDFPGCLLVASHDRYFLDKISDTLFVFEKGQEIKMITGICSDYLFSIQKRKPEKKGKIVRNKSNREKKLSFNEKKFKQQLEGKIPLLEKELDLLQQNLSLGEQDHKRVEQWSSLYTSKEEELMEIMTQLEEIERKLL